MILFNLTKKPQNTNSKKLGKQYYSLTNPNAIKKRYKIVGVTPAGRRRYIELLAPYLLKQRPLLNKHIFWLNTNNQRDICYIKDLCSKHPDFFQYMESEVPVNGNQSIANFFKQCVDDDTIYVRFDDDICWLADDALEKIVNFRINNPSYFIIFGNIINNAICNWLHQRIGAIELDIGFRKDLGYDCMDSESWAQGAIAETIHMSFLTHLKNKTYDTYKFDKWILKDYERFSINFMAFFGSDFSQFDGNVGKTEKGMIEEEPWLTEWWPKKIGRPNCICGDSLVSHFAFYPQREFLEESSEILEKYREIGKKFNTNIIEI